MKMLLLRLSGLLAVSVLLSACGGEWKEVEKTLGYRGKARLNPFLAAEMLLDELGHDAQGVKALTKMPDHDAVIMLSAESSLPAGRAKQLLRWTFSGGHLIYCLGGTRPYNDFDSQFGSFIAAVLLEEEKDPLLEQLGVGAKKRVAVEELKKELKAVFEGLDDEEEKGDEEESEAEEDEGDDDSRLELIQRIRWKNREFEVSLGGYQHLILERDLRAGEFSAGPKDESLALHLRHGSGRVTVLAHARPFRNRWIGERDHARWLAALVGGGGGKEVLFVAASTGSFFGLLWQHGWMALVALALCLIFWLWQQMPRFGPPAEVELDSTRHFASHVGALGEFFWRMRRADVLVTAAREAVRERVRERHRSLDDGGSQMSDALAAEIARRTGLSPERVAAAFDVAPPQSSHNFVHLMRDLQTIRQAL